MIALLVIGALSGFGTRWAFRRWSDANAIRRAVNEILAHLMEFRLFMDEPLLVLRAQRDLLFANARLLRLVLLPSLILAVPFTLLFAALDGRYGHAPLAVGEPAVVTMQLHSNESEPPLLHAPDGIAIETPAVRILSRHQVSWRVRPLKANAGRFPSGIQVPYPPATVFHLHWLVWFALAFLAGSILRVPWLRSPRRIPAATHP